MKAPETQRWDVSTAEAVEIQRKLAPLVVSEGSPADVRRVAGVDISVDRYRARARGAVVVLSYPELAIEEEVVIETALRFPYVPGLLSFREAPVILEAFERVRRMPDLLLVDGHGLAHPRRFGIACHLGVTLGLPTIGCAKSRLCGVHDAPSLEAGSRAPLWDAGEVIGSVVRTRDGIAPVFVSVGHLIGLDEAVEWTLRCASGYRIPEPLRQAHMAAGRHKTAEALKAG
ncbi:MAG: deoxyribonuclease V [Dehalococcoidia bacterium]|nr:deoxyribonuclease V [Dehalococcoidia bacterium]